MNKKPQQGWCFIAFLDIHTNLSRGGIELNEDNSRIVQ